MDSGSIVSVATRELPRLTTFTGGFDLSSASGLELGFDERREAEHLANEFKTEHYEVVLHAGDMEWVLPSLIWHLEDLRVGQSYPNYYVARLASRFVKVVLSGAGGDELFAGYPWRYYRGGERDFHASYYGYWQRLTPREGQEGAVHRGRAPRSRRPLDVRRLPCACSTDGRAATQHRRTGSTPRSTSSSRRSCTDCSSSRTSSRWRTGSRPACRSSTSTSSSSHCAVSPSEEAARSRHMRSFVDENEPGKRLIYEQERADGKVILREAMAPLLPPGTTARKKTGFSAPDASWFRGESIALRRPRSCAIRRLRCSSSSRRGTSSGSETSTSRVA